GCRVRLNDTFYGSIQAAMDDASPGDVIDVAGFCSGVHEYDTGVVDTTCGDGIILTTVHIDKDVTLRGGWDENFNGQNSETILDALNQGRVIYIAPGTSPTIEQFDIRQGQLSGANANGAGICIDQATPTISNNNIYSNTAVNGAAIYSFNSTALINGGNRIYSNDATANGGGLLIETTPLFTATIQNNFVYSNTAVNGGAIYNLSGNALLRHNTVVGNNATTGGAIYVAADAPEIRGNLIVSNTATTTGGAYGANGSSPTLSFNDFFAQTGGNFGNTILNGGTGSLTVDPQFEDESFSIPIDSLVVDMGDPTMPITDDFEADIRPSHQGIDMGADEVGGCFAYIDNAPDTIYGSLQLAIDAASDGNTIYVDGTCYGVNSRQNSDAVTVLQNAFFSKTLTINGNWRSGLHAQTSAIATLDALGNGRVVYVDSNTTVTLTEIIVQDGDATGAGIGNHGGGFYNTGTLILDDVEIQDNTASFGGGIFNTAVITIGNSIIEENNATDGAAFYNATSSGAAYLINENLFQNNTATANGGAVYQNDGLLRLDGNELFENSANQGGAVYLTGGTTNNVDVQNNFIIDNDATNGGGIFNNNTDANLLHNTLYANSASSGNGGGFYSQNNSPIIRNNIVDSNTGSGIHAPAGTNIDYNNMITPTNGYSGGATAGSFDIYDVPHYIDHLSGDFHLYDDSPGVDEADPSSPLIADYDGDLRPTNGGPDMGADEINSCLIRVISPLDSSENIYGVLQDAIDFAESFANPPDIEIARGECRGVQSNGSTSQVGYIQKDLNFIGSLRRSNFSDPNDYNNPDIGVSTVFNAAGNGRVINIALNANPSFTHIAFINGNASAGGGNGDGGGIYNTGGTVEFVETRICQSQAVNGGGYYGESTSVTDMTGTIVGFCITARVTERENGNVQSVTHEFFDGNSVTNNGGAIYIENRFDFRNIGIFGNSAGADGGGLYNAGSNNRIINGTFYSNTASVDGGGLYHASNNLAIYHNTFVHNTATTGDGGAIWHDDNSFILNSSILFENEAVTGTGGGISSNKGALSYNNYDGNSPNINPGDIIGAHAILANPRFKLFSTELTKDSPAIDTADPNLLISGAPGTAPFGTIIIDYDQNLDIRPDDEPNNTGIHGTGADRGADEYAKTFGCSILPTSSQATAVPGQSVNYIFSISNIGNYTDTFTVTLQTSQNWGVLQNGDLQIITLDGGDTVNRIITVTVPMTATTGLQDNSTIACQSGSLLSTSDSSPALTNVGLVAGVIVTPDYNDNALPGDVITYTHQVTNKGNEEGTFDLSPSPGPQHASADLVDSSGNILTDTIVTLLPDESITVLLRVNILPTAAANDLATPGVVATDQSNALNFGSSLNEILIGYTPGTRHVSAFGAANTTNCTDPTNPCATIQYAHDQSVDDDTILISTGTYTDTITRTIGVDIAEQIAYIEKSLTIRGGYNVADSFTSYEPITNAVTLNGEDLHRIFFIEDGITVTLNSLFIENGNAALQEFAPTDGGAVYNDGANLTITGTWFTSNSAQLGGALYNKQGDLFINSNVFDANSGSSQGGAIHIASGSTDVVNNTFVENTSGDGGAIYAASGSLDLFNNIFSDNSGNTDARAAYAITPTVVLSTNFNLYWSTLGLFDQTNFVTGTDSLIADPQFTDALYHISANSAAKDAGTSSGILVLADYELDSRPQGAFVDIGADERVQKPGFVFAPITLTAQIDSGTPFTYTHLITNTGDADDSYTLTMDNQSIPAGGGFTYALSPTTTPVVTQGESITVTFVITGGLPGYIDQTIITATSSTLISQSVMDTTTVSQTAGVDIETSQSSVGSPGQAVTYTHVLTNTGDGIDSFTISPLTAVPPNWTVTVSPTQTGILTPLGTFPFTVTVNIPPGTVSDTVHTVEIQAIATDPFASDILTDTTTVGADYGLTLTPNNSSTTVDNTQVVYTHTLQNIGNLTDTVTLSFSSIPSWTVDVQPTSVQLQPLVEQTIVVTVTVPVNTGGLTHTAVITAESEGGDMVTAVNTTTVDIIPGVLLESDSLIIDDAAVTVTHTHTLTNTGNVTDTFDIASVSSNGWLVAVTPSSIQVGPGLTETVTATVTIPALAAPPDADITVITATSQISATVFDVVTATTRVRQIHGLLFAPDNVITTSAGSTVTYTHILTNTGNGQDIFALTANSARSWPITLPPSPITVSSGISTNVVVTISVPIGATGLTDTLHVTATSTISPAVTGFVTNTTIVTGTPGTITVLIEPDNSDVGLPGATVTYTHQVTNTGDITETFSLDVVSENGWVTAVSPTNLLLNPLQSSTVTVTVTVPLAAINGDMDVVTVTARSDTEITTFDTAIDTTTAGQTYGVVLEPDNVDTADAGTTIGYTHVLTNTGNGTDTFTFAASSSNGWVTAVPADVTLNSGLSTTVFVSLTVPSGAAGLMDTMTVTATSTTDGAATDSAIDTTTVNGSVATLLVDIAPNNSSSADAGTTIQYQHTITNTGTITDDYTITAVSSEGWSITLLTEHVTLAPGDTAIISVRVMVPGTAVGNTVDTTTVTVTSDTDNAVSDTATDTTTVNADETFLYLPVIMNNYPLVVVPPTPTPVPTATPVPCSPTGIDLIVTEIRIEPATPTANQVATLFVTLRNQGSVNVAYGNNFFLDAYIDQIPASLLVGNPSWGVQGADLDAGTSKTFSAPITLSGGAHTIYAQADTDNTVNECPNENNNIFGPLSVFVSGTVNQNEPTQQPSIIGTRSTPTPISPMPLTLTPTLTPTEEK
ncbi:MAG: hypothetical protein GY943_22585, partial [Chloroflexi bacterium]|nr:hypothetical protein [Chloroflexota bacterium]